ncbi:MAG: cyclic nucleotide-binding domain-containing protein [Proteobacteria bacterium]|nr:cyclic nucleotide-binding domain-containing protein [Pseudomonadota bacterium]
MNASELKRFALFAEFTDEDREFVAELMDTLQVSKGAPVFREGSEANGLILVLSGTLRLENKRKGVLGQLEAGSVLGALSLMVVGPREATAFAEEPTQLGLLPRHSFRRLAEDSPRTACRLAEAITADFASYVRSNLGRFDADGD